jgi:hypothetical protein
MENLDDDSDDVVSTLLMCFMAGMTVARLGVPQEKNRVASNVSDQKSGVGERVTHPQNVSKLSSNFPFNGDHFVFAKVKTADGSHCINGNLVLKSELEHVKGGVPAS